MPDVPDRAEFDALVARVAALETAQKPVPDRWHYFDAEPY